MIKRNIAYSLVIILTIIQCFILINLDNNKINKDLISSDSNSISNLKNVKYIKDIVKDLENNKTLKILSYNKLENSNWEIKCILEGSKEEVLSDIENLNYYNITSYNLNYENKKILLELELINI